MRAKITVVKREDFNTACQILDSFTKGFAETINEIEIGSFSSLNLLITCNAYSDTVVLPKGMEIMSIQVYESKEAGYRFGTLVTVKHDKFLLEFRVQSYALPKFSPVNILKTI
jgi:hypothetical protein